MNSSPLDKIYQIAVMRHRTDLYPNETLTELHIDALESYVIQATHFGDEYANVSLDRMHVNIAHTLVMCINRHNQKAARK